MYRFEPERRLYAARAHDRSRGHRLHGHHGHRGADGLRAPRGHAGGGAYGRGSARARALPGGRHGPDDVPAARGARERLGPVGKRGPVRRHHLGHATTICSHTAADQVTPINLPPGARDHAKRYEAGTSPFGSVVLPDLDQSDDVVNGTLSRHRRRHDAERRRDARRAGVGFNSQGVPVAVDTPLQPGTGAGGIYVTDNDDLGGRGAGSAARRRAHARLRQRRGKWR